MCKFQDGAGCLSHRLLDTFTLNFTQPDPSRQEMNNSTYAECDPINKMDPTGLSNVPTPQAACWGATIYMLKLSAASAVLGVGGTPVHIATGWLLLDAWRMTWQLPSEPDFQ